MQGINQQYITTNLYQLQSYLESTLYEHYPRLANMNHFDKFIILNIVLLLLKVLISLVAKINPISIYKRIIKFIFKRSYFKNKIQKRLQQMRKTIYDSIPDYGRSKISKIPNKVTKIQIGDISEKQSLKGFLSGSRYCSKSHSDFVISLSKQFAYSNPLHIDLHPYLKQMEVEVIKMTAKMLQFEMISKIQIQKQLKEKRTAIGAMTSGGTQSIFNAILAYREYGIKYRGVQKPNLVMCKTAHVAAIKACEYLQIEVRLANFDKNYQMDIGSMKGLIDYNTIAVYTSYPNYPYGTVDPIQSIAKICKRKDLPVHIDMCLGGFVVPFLKNKKGEKIFTVPQGVTSISVDPHKYGLSGKGASVILYSHQKYLRQQFFGTSFWPGGLYGTIGIAGSRSGGPIASAWVSLMKNGVEGYTKAATAVSQATLLLSTQLPKIGFYIYGNPNICVIAFHHKVYSVNSIQNEMNKKGWKLALNQKPLSLHFSFTPLNCEKVKTMLADFKDAVNNLAKKPIQKDTAQVELYGACAKIPDSDTKQTILKTLLDCMIDV